MKLQLSFLAALLCVLGSDPALPDEPFGLVINNPGAFEGYNLFAPLNAATIYLIDNQGRVINSWDSDYKSGCPYLLENGHLLRNATYGNDGNGTFHGGGAGHAVEEFSWEGEKLWEFVYSSEDYLMHHDIAPLPNGNVLIIAWERKTKEEAVAAGRDPELLGDDELWPLHVIEVKPKRPKGGDIVWEWHLWDHLIQDFDETKANYGDPAAHPELVEINPPGFWMDRITKEEMEKLKALGYIGGGGSGEPEEDSDDDDDGREGRADWMHTNAIDYNIELDQIALSALGNDELWIIDHSTTTEEARGHTGGRSGKGGDLLYRWGNPAAYRAGTEGDQQLFAQHDVNWIPEGRPGAGNLLVFNNGRGRADGGEYSSIAEIAPPIKPDGSYLYEPGKAFGPAAPTWEYTAPNKEDFHSSFISGTRRQPNGNTLICEGATGTFLEVTADKKMVWRFVNPVTNPDPDEDDDDDEEGNPVFRVYRYPPDYPGLHGKDLTPGPLLTEYIKNNPAKVPRKRDEDE